MCDVLYNDSHIRLYPHYLWKTN